MCLLAYGLVRFVYSFIRHTDSTQLIRSYYRPGLGMSFKGDIQIGQSRVVYRTGLKNTGLEVDYFELENGSRDQLKKTLTTIMFAFVVASEVFFSCPSKA